MRRSSCNLRKRLLDYNFKIPLQDNFCPHSVCFLTEAEALSECESNMHVF